MAGQSSAIFGWSWTEVSLLDSQVLGQALMDSYDHYSHMPITTPMKQHYIVGWITNDLMTF